MIHAHDQGVFELFLASFFEHPKWVEKYGQFGQIYDFCGADPGGD